MKIKTLPAHISAQFPALVKAAIADGLRTGAADRPRAERAVRDLYRLCNLNPDVPIIWVPSPLVGVFAASIAAEIIAGAAKKGSVDSAVHSAVHSAVRSAVSSAVSLMVSSTVSSAVSSTVSSAVNSAVRSAVSSAVETAVYSVHSVHSAVYSTVEMAVSWAVRSAVDTAVNSAVNSAGNLPWHAWRGGQFWIAWPAFIEAIMLLGVDHPSFAALRAEAEMCRSTCYYWPNRDFIMICERPQSIVRDANGRLHNLDGPSITWGETFSLYSWKGVTVPWGMIVNRHTTKAADILTEKNAELRRCGMEIYAATHGPDRFISDLGGKEIAADTNHGQPRRLYAIGDDLFVRVVNGSREPDGSCREFMLGAPRSALTPAEVIAWSYGIPANKYKEAVRT